MPDYPRVECQAHGWQNTGLITRYERRAKPREVPDRFICLECAAENRPPDATNSIKVAQGAFESGF